MQHAAPDAEVERAPLGQFGADFGEGALLVEAADPRALEPLGVAPLLQGGVVELGAEAEGLAQALVAAPAAVAAQLVGAMYDHRRQV